MIRFFYPFYITVSLFVIIIFAFSINKVDLLNKVGNKIVKIYNDIYVSKFKVINENIQDSDLKKIDELLSNYADIKKGDRIYPLKRSLLRRYSLELYDRENYDKLLNVSSSWYKNDKRDITALIIYINALKLTNKYNAKKHKSLIEFSSSFILKDNEIPLSMVQRLK